MERAKKLVLGFVRDERGTEALEWGLVAGVIVLGAAAAMYLLGPKVTSLWNKVNAQVTG
jgi:Flp pilus assembly pilin Flp